MAGTTLAGIVLIAILTNLSVSCSGKVVVSHVEELESTRAFGKLSTEATFKDSVEVAQWKIKENQILLRGSHCKHLQTIFKLCSQMQRFPIFFMLLCSQRLRRLAAQ